MPSAAALLKKQRWQCDYRKSILRKENKEGKYGKRNEKEKWKKEKEGKKLKKRKRKKKRKKESEWNERKEGWWEWEGKGGETSRDCEARSGRKGREHVASIEEHSARVTICVPCASTIHGVLMSRRAPRDAFMCTASVRYIVYISRFITTYLLLSISCWKSVNNGIKLEYKIILLAYVCNISII